MRLRLSNLLLLAAFVAPIAIASDIPLSKAGSRVGLGQETAAEPPILKNLRLSDPLVQQKYLSDPDMLRFLRATYSEGCSRGLLNNAAKEIRTNAQGIYSEQSKVAAKRLIDTGRVWKMTSMEMEAMFGSKYLDAANYCDCLMKEVADTELINPKKGLEVVEKISPQTQRTCQSLAREKTEAQLKLISPSKD